MPQDEILEKVKTQLNITEKEIIWLGHPPRMQAPSIALIFTLVIKIGLMVFATKVLFIFITASKSINMDRYAWLVAIILGCLFFLYQIIHFTNRQQNIWYGVTDKMVFWIQGKKVNKLLYSEIAKVHLVGRNDKPEYFSIHFTPNKKINFTGYNYEKVDTRPLPSFELIWKGDAVYKDIMVRWKDTRRKINTQNTTSNF